MTLLSKIQSGKQSLPPRILLYGVEGIGKSTLGADSDAPIFVQTEDGLAEIACDRFPLAQSLTDVLEALSVLLTENHSYQTVVIDSLDWLERLIWDALCREYSVSSIEKVDGGYARGYTHALTHWRQVLDALNQLRFDRGMAVICIAHSKIERFEDPEAASYDRFTPRLNKHAAGLICEWSDAVLFATRKFRTQTEETGFGRKRAIANPIGAAGGDRVLRCVGGPSCIAKNRFNLPEELPLSWAALVQAISQNQKEELHV